MVGASEEAAGCRSRRSPQQLGGGEGIEQAYRKPGASRQLPAQSNSARGLQRAAVADQVSNGLAGTPDQMCISAWNAARERHCAWQI